MLALVNDARGDAGIHPVELDPRLTARAERNSSGMARTHRLSHSGHLRAHMGECVGAGPSLRAIMRAFMRSPEHRRIILNRHYRSVGVGVAISRGTYWVTLTFD
jgi:uncharacterized protein YkwD